MTTLLVILGIVVYLLIGYAWAMVFIHVLTDGYWEEGYLYPRKVPMGAGMAVTWTLLWPVIMASCLLIVVSALIGMLFDQDLWKRLYRLRG